jgi:hypothetical protein
MPTNAQMSAAQAAQQIEAQNRLFMQQSLEKVAYCPVTGGSGTTATYTPGTTLYFDFPQLGGAYIKGLSINYNLTVNPLTGFTYNLNAAGLHAMFSEIKLDYGNTQVRTHPYFLKLIEQLRYMSSGAQNNVTSGQNDSFLTAQIAGDTLITVTTANKWIGKIYLPLNVLGDDSVPGLLPAMSVGNTPQLKLTCTPNFLGADPLMNVLTSNNNASAGFTTAVTGTIGVDAVYLDGSTMRTNVPLSLNLDTEPTLQYYWESALTPFNSGTTWQRKQITTRLEHWLMASIIIDGQRSDRFMTDSTGSASLSPYTNLAAFEIGPDQSGQNVFKGWNSGNNIPIYDYYDREMRRHHGQDLDPGVILWVDAVSRGVTNPDNRHGSQVLNMTPNGGFVATNHAYQVNTVSTSNSITPRVETFLLSMNYDGLNLVH